MEKSPSLESRESLINKAIEKLAHEEGMSAEDILSDIATSLELSQGNECAKAYLEEVAEKTGILVEELTLHVIGNTRS